MGVRKIAVFYQNDAYGRAGLSGIESALRKRNLSIIETATVERNSTDVRAAVQKLVNKKPEVIVQISAYSSSAALIQQMREQGQKKGTWAELTMGTAALLVGVPTYPNNAKTFSLLIRIRVFAAA